tara:strand:- start:291 stop:440 length:150 start_codon:yes stop_codon:yes gene_type:complete
VKKYANWEDNQRRRRNLKRQGYVNIKIKNGKVVAADLRSLKYLTKKEGK